MELICVNYTTILSTDNSLLFVFFFHLFYYFGFIPDSGMILSMKTFVSRLDIYGSLMPDVVLSDMDASCIRPTIMYNSSQTCSMNCLSMVVLYTNHLKNTTQNFFKRQFNSKLNCLLSHTFFKNKFTTPEIFPLITHNS